MECIFYEKNTPRKIMKLLQFSKFSKDKNHVSLGLYVQVSVRKTTYIPTFRGTTYIFVEKNQFSMSKIKESAFAKIHQQFF